MEKVQTPYIETIWQSGREGDGMDLYDAPELLKKFDELEKGKNEMIRRQFCVERKEYL